MDYIITENKLLNLFFGIMEEYSNLEHTEKSYDYYDYEKGRYADIYVVNYYHSIDLDWEDDDWVFQVQYVKGDLGQGLELPILRYAEYQGMGRFVTIKSMFGDQFNSLLKQWFNIIYHPYPPIKTVITEPD